VRRHRGVLLADRAGTGKTYIALAVAATLAPDQPIQVLAPATLQGQWLEAASRTGLRIRFHSYEMVSRGTRPAPDRGIGPAILDESHRLRNPETRRYRTLAPWCIGRPGILLSATPAVNRMEDVVHQLLLFVRDDAFAWTGAASLTQCILEGRTGLLSRLVITGEDRTGLLPGRRGRTLRIREEPGSPGSALLGGITSLDLSADPTTAGLIRVSLLSALASSPLALAEALARYVALLVHARDAAASGVILSRAAIRRFAGPEGEQLVLWPLVAESSPTDLALHDLERAGALETLARRWSATADAKVRTLAAVTLDQHPTIAFTAFLGTVRYLKRHLGPAVAWCTGSGAGVGSLELPREEVLDWFRKPETRTARGCRMPTLLIATDVASEGLDLALLERVVHYDLPWTAVRLDQRIGRATRLGAAQASIDEVRLLPGEAIEAVLRKEAILDVKRGFPELLGLDDRDDAPWRLRAKIAAEWLPEPAAEGVAAVHGPDPGAAAGIRMTFCDGTSEEFVVILENDRCSDDLASLARLLDRARQCDGGAVPAPATLRAVLGRLSRIARRALRQSRAGRLGGPHHAVVRRIRRRLLAVARESARRRQGRELGLLENGLRFLGRGHTAGVSALVNGWDVAPIPDLVRAVKELPEEPPQREPCGVELIGLLLVTRTSSLR